MHDTLSVTLTEALTWDTTSLIPKTLVYPSRLGTSAHYLRVASRGRGLQEGVVPGFAGGWQESIHSQRGEGPQGCPAVRAALARPAGGDVGPEACGLPGSPGC